MPELEATQQEEKQFDPETASFDELAKLALAEAMKEPEEVAAAEEEQAAEQQEQTPAMKFRREIDLGDGSGRQVFEAETMEALVDALTQAQTHATKKIRELSREVKVEKAAEKAPERELTADEEWLLSQELLNHPSKTQKKLIEGLIGMPVEQFRAKLARLDEYDMLQRANQASIEFVKKHTEDFHACPANQSRMVRYMETYNLEPTVENLEKAFTDLNASGLLERKPEESAVKSAESDTAADEQESRIAKAEAKPVTPPQRKVASGLSSRGRTAPPVKTTQPTEDELYSMPLDKLEQLANASFRSGQ